MAQNLLMGYQKCDMRFKNEICYPHRMTFFLDSKIIHLTEKNGEKTICSVSISFSPDFVVMVRISKKSLNTKKCSYKTYYEI